MVEIIAEIANAHQGDVDVACRLMKASAEAGVDAVKFQIYLSHELVTEKHPKYNHFRKLSFDNGSWDYLLKMAAKEKIKVYADIFGPEAFEIAKSNNVNGFKVHSSDLTNTQLLNKIAGEEKKVFLAVGGSTVLEMRYAVDRILSLGKVPEIILMHGFQAYPTRIEDVKLSRIGKLRELFGETMKIGYADHTDADTRYVAIAPLISVACGASYIEKHVTLDRRARGIDFYSSLQPDELKQLVKDIRIIEKSIGDKPFEFSNAEKKYRNEVKKNWVSINNLKKGNVIKSQDITMKRAKEPCPSPIYEKIINKQLIRDLGKEETVRNLDIRHKVLAIVVARTASSRLPDKALLDINGKPAIAHLFERIKRSLQKGDVDTVAFCTTTNSLDDRLVDIAVRFPFKIYRGSEENVLSRMLLAIEDNSDHDVVLRITADDLLVDSQYLKKTVDYHLQTNAHYTDAKNLPSGTEVEAFDSFILKLIYELSKDSSGSEYLTDYIKHNKDQFNISNLPVENRHTKNYRLTLDTEEDYEVIKIVLGHMKKIGKEYDYDLDNIVAFFDKNPGVLDINKLTKHQRMPAHITTEMQWHYITRPPVVTVYIVNRNYGKFIKQSIDSVLNQKFKDFELIIIDNSSTDDSRKIIDRYRSHPKTKIIYQHNKSLNASNNVALRAARGKYIMRLDADDYLDDNALLLMKNKLEEDDNLGLIFPDYYLVDEENVVFSHERRHNFEEVRLKDQPAHGACTMIRKSALLEIGSYCEDFDCQDGYELWIKFIGKFKVANINLPLFYYRKHAKSLTRNQGKILSTRHEIIKKQVSHLDLKRKNHICVIPIRGMEGGFPLALKTIAGKTLLEKTIECVLASENISKVILTTCNDSLLMFAEKLYGNRIITDKRPYELSMFNVKLENTLDYLIEKYGSKLGNIDSITLLNFEFPLRKTIYVDKAINTLYLFEADSVLSAMQTNRNFYRHDGNSLMPFSTNSILRLERDYVYEETGGIHTVLFKAYKKYRNIVCGKVSHIVIDNISAINVSSGLDLEVARFVEKNSQGIGNDKPIVCKKQDHKNMQKG